MSGRVRVGFKVGLDDGELLFGAAPLALIFPAANFYKRINYKHRVVIDMEAALYHMERVTTLHAYVPFKQHIGDDLPDHIPTEQITQELCEKYEYFHLILTRTGHGKEPRIREAWKNLLGERALMLDDEDAVSETIALTIGMPAGTVGSLNKGSSDLIAAGSSKSAIDAAVKATKSIVATSDIPAAYLQMIDGGLKWPWEVPGKAGLGAVWRGRVGLF